MDDALQEHRLDSLRRRKASQPLFNDRKLGQATTHTHTSASGDGHDRGAQDGVLLRDSPATDAMSVKPDKTSPYAQPALYGNTSPRASAEAGDEEEPQPAFSYLAGHTPDQLYGNASPTERQSATLPSGSAHKPPPDGRGEDWLPPLQTGGYGKRGLPRHTFSDVGQPNQGYTPNEYSQIGNGRHNSTGNLAPDGRGQPRNSNYPSDFPAMAPNPGDGGYDAPGRYSTAGRGQPRNSNYPNEFTAVGPNSGERQPGHYEEFPDRQQGGHYDAYPTQSTAVDIGMSDMSATTNGPGQDGLDSLKRNRGVRPTTKHTHLGKLPSVSEEPRKEPARCGCLCICVIVVAVIVALAVGFAAGWFLHGTGVAGGAGE